MPPKIVVGTDGSTESQHAFAWAIDEARLRGAEVVLVHAFEHVPLWQLQGLDGLVAVDTELVSREDLAALAEAERQGAALLQEVAEDVDQVAIHRVLRSDARPAVVLVELSGDAELLVLGSRGLGGVRGILLGSVSQHCVTHAKCPVVVVNRATSRDARIAG